jgi:hypothetical protein
MSEHGNGTNDETKNQLVFVGGIFIHLKSLAASTVMTG